jgi:hypothetical protein
MTADGKYQDSHADAVSLAPNLRSVLGYSRCAHHLDVHDNDEPSCSTSSAKVRKPFFRASF